MRFVTAFAIAILVALPLPAQGIDAVDKIARDAMAAWNVPGLAIAVVRNDRIVHLKGYGAREIGGAPVTPDTLFQIASTSKAFTTAAMAILVDEKKMKWDDPVRAHLDYFRLADPCADSMVTLRDIVSHRTGLSRHDELWDYGDFSRQDILRRVSSIDLTRSFRSAYQYQNIMFMAATDAAGSAAGMPFERFAKTRLFEPLGMRNTVFSAGDWSRAERAQSYRWDAAKRTITPRTLNSYETLGGAGSIKSSARDMAQWIRFQLNDGEIDGKRIVSADALKETRKPATVLPSDESAREDHPETNINTYALGWRVQDYRGELQVWHSGSLNGYRTVVNLLPRRNIGFVVLSSLDRSYAVSAIRNAIADLMLNSDRRDWNAYYLAVEARSREKDEKEKLERAAKRHSGTKPSREPEAYAGTYQHPAYGTATVTATESGLALKWARLDIPLRHFHFDTFNAIEESEDLDEQVIFRLGADGSVASLEFFGEEFRR